MGAHGVAQRENCRISEQRAIFNRQIDARHILVHHAPGSDIQMSNL